MVFFYDWWLLWNPEVSSSDASESGFGVCEAVWPLDVVKRTGRITERSRFRRVGPHSARESALTSAGFERDSDTGQWVAAASEGCLEAWELDQDFPEVPAAGLRRELWRARLWGKWEYKEDILILEARTLVKSLRRVALTTFGHDLRQLLLTDNMAVCLAFDRSRCREFGLLVQIGCFCAYCLARNIRVSVRWIPSELKYVR